MIKEGTVLGVKTDADATFGLWKVEGHPRSIEFAPSFWDEIVSSVMKNFLRLPWGGHEVGGVLFGAWEPDCLRIAGHRPLSCEHAKGPSFELSENDKAGLRKLFEEAQMDEELTGMQPVGWYLSKYRSFDLTRDDLEIYKSFFPELWQVAMVFQRAKAEPCVLGFFFRREDGSIQSARRTFTVIGEWPGVQPEPRAQDTPTRSALSDPILAGPGVADPPTPLPVSPSLPAAPESERQGPKEVTRAPATHAVPAEPSAERVPEARPERADGSSLLVSAHRADGSPLPQRPEYKRILQYLDPVPGAQPELPPFVENTLAQLSYCAFLGLRKNPFSQGAIPEFPYWSPQHQETLAALRYGVQTRKGLMVVTGESGTGKTLLLKCLGGFLTEQSIEFAFLPNSKLTAEEFYERVDDDLELGCTPPSKPNVLRALSTLLDARAMQDKTTVLIIDDAQNLKEEVLEGIQQWDSLQDRRGRLLQTVLCGFPGLERRLGAEKLRPLKQRVALRCHLRPFTAEETVQYIAGQLVKAGMTEQTIFGRQMIAEIHARSGGLLRVVNIVCDKLLEKCFEARSTAATIGMLDKVSNELQLETR